MNILTLNKISKVGTNEFSGTYSVSDSCENPDAIMVRSASMHEMVMPDSLLAIARAGAGVNNIPINACAEKGIVVFNTPGANANAVKELAIASLILASRDIVGGIEWVKTLSGDDIAKQVEKGKSNFAGHEISGKTLGVVGLGAIGVNVANAAYSLGMKVLGYDPYISLKSAWNLSSHIGKASTLDELYEKCDMICIHAPLTDETNRFVNEESIAKMKDNMVIINLSRADLVNDADIAKALENGKIAKYITDFPNPDTVKMKNCICIPHLGASTEESEDNCAYMAARELIDYLENGNITNSVNFPNVEMPKASAVRICVFHKNVPAILSKVSSVISSQNINIANMINKSKGDFAYTMIDCDDNITDETITLLKNIDGIIRIRVIK